jgi:hypothetical protein
MGRRKLAIACQMFVFCRHLNEATKLVVRISRLVPHDSGPSIAGVGPVATFAGSFPAPSTNPAAVFVIHKSPNQRTPVT